MLFYLQKDFEIENCDLLIILGTSLKVQPFASLVNKVSNTTPRLLINLEQCGECDPMLARLGLGAGLDFSEEAYRYFMCQITASGFVAV